MPPTKKVIQIKVTLLGSRPPIWRRLLVPSHATLAQLHGILQTAMGWQNCHGHDFRIGDERFADPDPDEGFLDLSDSASEETARLSDVLGKVGATAIYTYDFGDGWEHGVTVEKILAADPERTYPVCLGGKRHGPPEDCGGIPGYYFLLDAISDPEHEQHEQLLEWVGEGFDPDDFSVYEVSQELARPD